MHQHKCRLFSASISILMRRRAGSWEPCHSMCRPASILMMGVRHCYNLEELTTYYLQKCIDKSSSIMLSIRGEFV